TIPDGGSLDSKIVISDSLAVNDLAVRVNITHAQLADVDVTLIAPDGVTQVPLYAGTPGQNLVNTVFDGLAPDFVTGGTGNAGSFRPLSLVKSAAVSTGGFGYAVGNILTVQGGTFSTAATLRVTSIGFLGSITGVAVVSAGSYTAKPFNAVSVTGG